LPNDHALPLCGDDERQTNVRVRVLMPSFAELELEVIRWSEARKIIPNSTAQAQFIKLQEEVNELRDALLKNDMNETVDAIGDCTVVLLNICALLDVNFTDCLAHAYDQIKDRTGTMGKDGIFYKNS
jgi:NTP pyrophosphatase (non-canonical NTP hydrolase)